MTSQDHSGEIDAMIKRLGFSVLLGLAWTSPGLAQMIPHHQQFRDPATGKIWAPDNVGSSSGSNTPQDRAFDPQAQTTATPGTSVQVPKVTLLGAVAVTAGPTVPIATIDNATLSAVPGQRWQVVLYLDNNSARTISPVIDCRFTNAGITVENVRANLLPIAAGQRVGITISGPQTTLFVDRAECQIASV